MHNYQEKTQNKMEKKSFSIFNYGKCIKLKLPVLYFNKFSIN